MSVVTTGRSGVYHLLPMLYIKVRIKLSALDYVNFFLKLFCIILGSCDDQK